MASWSSTVSEAADGELPILARYARAMLAPAPTIPIACRAPCKSLALGEVTLRFAAWLSEKECLVFPRVLSLDEDSHSLYVDVWLNTFARRPDIPGFSDQPCHQVRLWDLRLDVREVAYFCGKARAWLDLTLAEMALRHFDGQFTLGWRDQFDLTFKPRRNLPDKTDWFTLTACFRNQGGHGEHVLDSDRSCLEEFVSGWETLGV